MLNIIIIIIFIKMLSPSIIIIVKIKLGWELGIHVVGLREYMWSGLGYTFDGLRE